MSGKLNSLNLAMSMVLTVDRKDFDSDNVEEIKQIDLNYGKKG
jgi:hypothetical protein